MDPLYEVPRLGFRISIDLETIALGLVKQPKLIYGDFRAEPVAPSRRRNTLD